MIRSQSEFLITLAWASRFDQDADELAAGRALAPGVAPELRIVLIEAARSEARRLRVELAEYVERIRGGGHDHNPER